MIKLYCDTCGVAISEDANRTVFRLDLTPEHSLQVDVIVAVDGVWNGGQTCLPCVRRAVTEGVVQKREGSLHGTLRSD